MKMGISWLPGALSPAAFALVLQGGGSRCARRICCHLLATECERRRREHSSGKKADTIGIKRYLRVVFRKMERRGLDLPFPSQSTTLGGALPTIHQVPLVFIILEADEIGDLWGCGITNNALAMSRS